jgi:hypothetical protein
MAKNILERDYMRYPKASDMPAFQKGSEHQLFSITVSL